jgi:hypothetical protein
MSLLVQYKKPTNFPAVPQESIRHYMYMFGGAHHRDPYESHDRECSEIRVRNVMKVAHVMVSSYT